MSLDPNKTYLEWNGTTFPNSTKATFKAPADSEIDWGDGTIETFATASTEVTTHTYMDGFTKHTIVISGLTSIGQSAFESCSSLTSVTIPDSVTNIRALAFNNCAHLTSVTIGNSVASIGDNAFSWCSSLASIAIPDSVTSIARGVFVKCIALASVTIGNGVKSIPYSTFAFCNKLKSIIIPDSVTSIGVQAFDDCTNLKTIILFPSTPPTLASTDAIPAITTIYVQQSSKETYRTATNWTAFADKFVSDNLYLSLIQFNKKNKEYIDMKVEKSSSTHISLGVTGAKKGQGVRIKSVDENGKPTEWEAVEQPNEYTLTVNVVRVVDGANVPMPYDEGNPVTVTIYNKDGKKLVEKVYDGTPVKFNLVEFADYKIGVTEFVAIDGINYFSPIVLNDEGEGVITGNKEVYLKYADSGSMETIADVKAFLALGLDLSIYRNVLVSEDGASGFVFDLELTVPNADETAPKVKYTMPCRVLEVGNYQRLNESGEEETFVGAKVGFDYTLPSGYPWDTPEQVYADEVTFQDNAEGVYYYKSNSATVSESATITRLVQGTDYQVGDSIEQFQNENNCHVLHHAWNSSNTDFIKYGSNVYHESNIDKWLNGKDTDWFTPSHLGDICNYSDRIGFLNWFKTDDLSLIEKNCKWGVYERSGKETPGNVIYRQFVLPSGTEIAGNVNSNEGSVFKYWLNKNGGAVSSAGNSNRTIKRIDLKTSPQNFWLRSPNRGSLYYAWYLHISGIVSHYGYVNASYCVAPLFII